MSPPIPEAVCDVSSSATITSGKIALEKKKSRNLAECIVQVALAMSSRDHVTVNRTLSSSKL